MPAESDFDHVSRPDLAREQRKGVPEIIYAPGKAAERTVEIARAFLDGSGRAIVSRCNAETRQALEAAFSDADVHVYRASQMVVLRTARFQPPARGGVVGVITAGTSDVPMAEEAVVMAEEMGCTVLAAFDVGVAGLHRLFEPLHRFESANVDVIVVAAGMDGALPSVVSGLVAVPVIGLPTSVGYGFGGKGLGALMSMLQTCSPGLTVVNIDNGVGAGATAALIANRMERLRHQATGPAPHLGGPSAEGQRHMRED